jgi:hypothetical protein
MSTLDFIKFAVSQLLFNGAVRIQSELLGHAYPEEKDAIMGSTLKLLDSEMSIIYKMKGDDWTEIKKSQLKDEEESSQSPRSPGSSTGSSGVTKDESFPGHWL